MRIVVTNAKGGSGRTVLAISLSLLGHSLALPRAGDWRDRIAPGIQRYDSLDDLAGQEDYVIEPPVDQEFVACRQADLVAIPTFLDPLSLQVLWYATLPIVALTGRPAFLYAIEPREGAASPAPLAETWWRIVADRFAAGAVSFAPWQPNGEWKAGPHKDALRPAIEAARPLPVLPDDVPDTGEVTHLYRHVAADGVLLYVGISGDPVFRYRYGHADKAWTHEVATIDVETFPLRWMARQAELVAIAREQPLYNIADRPRGGGVGETVAVS